MIIAKGLTKIYGKGDLELFALDDINLEIKSGEFVAITGASGAGKSTLLYQLSLLDNPTKGEIFLDNIQTSSLSDKEKTAIRLNKLGYVFQDYALLPELTSMENTILPLLSQGLSWTSARVKAEKALTRMGLGDKLNNLPSELSGGQQQRVSIARAIAHDPHIVFADEPTANLDTGSAKPVMDAFLHLHRDGQTIVMITHEDEYARFAERVIELKDGQLVG
jgi:putative ABC transport system ATP-binding protein